MKSKLNLDSKVVDSARQHAANIAHDMQEFIERHTTVSTERTIVRLLGIDGVDEFIEYLKSCYVSNIWKGATMTRELNLWVKKHEDLSKGKLEDNFEV